MIPGRLLRRLALHFCPESTRAVVIESLIADLQHEWSQSSPHRRSIVLVRGYSAFWRALILCSLRGITSLDMTMDDRRDLVRTCWWALILVAVMTVAFLLPPQLQLSGGLPLTLRRLHFATLIPQALPLAVPVGLTLAIILGIARPVSRASTKVILAIAAVCSIASFATMGWVMPSANQAFRTAIHHRLGFTGTPIRGDNELTLAELKREIVTANAANEYHRARRLSAALHTRPALAFATLVLAAFALVLRNQYRKAGRIKLIAVACAVFALWLFLFYAGNFSIQQWGVPPIAGVWLPNVVFTFYILLLTYRTQFRVNHQTA